MALLTPINSATSPTNTYLIDSQQMEILITFENEDGISYPMSKGNIVSLILEDTLLEWYVQGTLTYRNDFEFFEKNYKQNPDSSTRTPYYKYTNDARDGLKIKIRPLISSDTVNLPEKTWTMDYDFVIYDMHDIDTGSNTEKLKKIFFWERKYQLFSESNIEFSTAQFAITKQLTSPSQMSDEQRSMYTGDAIKQFIKSVLGTNEIFSTTLWNRGSSKINYVSSSIMNAKEDLEFLLAYHTSNDNGGDLNDVCVLRDDRFTGEWQLIPLHKLFELSTDGKNAGAWQLEHFYLQEQTTSTVPAVPCAPIDTTDALNKDIYLGQYSTIDSYQYVDMAGIDNAGQLQSRTVHSHDKRGKTFFVEKDAHSIGATQDFFKNNYAAKLFTKTSMPQPMFQTNSTKTNNIANIHSYSTIKSSQGRMAAGRNISLKSALFLNTCINFKCKGSTHRQAGRFVAIDKQTGMNDTFFDGKILGQWLAVKVNHIFTGDSYENELTAVKIHNTILTK